MSSVVALVVASLCLAVVGALFIIAVAVITFFVHKSVFSNQDSGQDLPSHMHVNSSRDSREPSQNQLAVCDLTSPVRSQSPRDFVTADINDRSLCDASNKRLHHSSSSNGSIDGRQSGSLISGGIPSSRAHKPSHTTVEMTSPAESLEDLSKGYAAFLACKFSVGNVALLSNVSAVIGSYDLDTNDICYCFLCLEKVVKSEGVEGLAIKPHGLNSYSARIWIVSLARFIKYAQGHLWAEDDDRVRPLAEEWQYQADHFLLMIKSCDAPFKRNHGFELIQAFRQEEIRRNEVARAQQSMIMLGALTSEAAPRHIVKAQPAGSRLFGTAAGINVDAKALSAPQRPALANAPFAVFGHSFPAFDHQLDAYINGGNGSSLALMGKRRQEDMQDGCASSRPSVHKRSRLALPAPEPKTSSRAASTKAKGGRNR